MFFSPLSIFSFSLKIDLNLWIFALVILFQLFHHILKKSLSSHQVEWIFHSKIYLSSFAASFHIDLGCCFKAEIVDGKYSIRRKRDYSLSLLSLLSFILFFILPIIIAALTAPIELPAITSKRGLFFFGFNFLIFFYKDLHIKP